MRISDWSSDVCSSDLVELDEVFVDERLQYPETSARAQARRARNRVDALPGMGREMPQNRNCVDDGCYRQNSLQLCEGPARPLAWNIPLAPVAIADRPPAATNSGIHNKE